MAIVRGCDFPDDLAYDNDLGLWFRVVGTGSWEVGMTPFGLARAGEVKLQGSGVGTGLVPNGDGPQPEGSNQFLKMGHRLTAVLDCIHDGQDISLGDVPKGLMMLVGHGVQKGADARRVVVQPEIRRRQDGGTLTLSLEEVGQDANEITSLLGIRGY